MNFEACAGGAAGEAAGDAEEEVGCRTPMISSGLSPSPMAEHPDRSYRSVEK